MGEDLEKESDRDFYLPEQQIVLHLFDGSVPLFAEDWEERKGGQPTGGIGIRVVKEEELEESEEDWQRLEEVLGVSLREEEPSVLQDTTGSRSGAMGVSVSSSESSPQESLLGEPLPSHLALGYVLQKFWESEVAHGPRRETTVYVVREGGRRVPWWRIVASVVIFLILCMVALELFLPTVGGKIGLEIVGKGISWVASHVLRLFS
ncbi:MAG: hypothetical protein QXH08_03090 [Candidatus Hadarchaeales archaeon]